MTPEEERVYISGQRAALVQVIWECARQLSADDPLAKAVLEAVEVDRKRGEQPGRCGTCGSRPPGASFRPSLPDEGAPRCVTCGALNLDLAGAG